MANYSARGYEVYIPMGNTRADFIACKDYEVLKIQVKSCATRHYKAKDTKYTLGILTTTRNGVTAPYELEEVDEFFIVGETMAWVIPSLLVVGRKTVMLESTVVDYQPRHGLDVEAWRVSL